MHLLYLWLNERKENSGIEIQDLCGKRLKRWSLHLILKDNSLEVTAPRLSSWFETKRRPKRRQVSDGWRSLQAQSSYAQVEAQEANSNWQDWVIQRRQMHFLDEKHQIDVDKVLNLLEVPCNKAETRQIKDRTCFTYCELSSQILWK